MPAVYTADVGCLRDRDVFDAAYRSVKPYRQKKIDRLLREKDRRLSLGAELLLKSALTRHGVDYDTTDILTDDNGKPHLRGESLYFSLSHSGERVMCAVSDRPVGCDIQKITTVGDRLAARYFSPREYAAFAALKDEESRRQMFFRIWTRKESYAKAIGAGMKMPFASFDVLTDGALPFFFRDYDENDGYRSAICSAYDDAASPERIFLINMR